MSLQEKLTHSDFQYIKELPALWAIILPDNNSSYDIEHNKFNLKKSHTKPIIQKTWMQAQEITSDSHIVTVANIKQRNDFRKMGKRNIPGKIIFQPESNCNAAAIFLGLAHILAKDPNARVVIFPVADYYQEHDRNLTMHINQATEQLISHPEKGVFLAESSSCMINKNGQVIEVPTNSTNIIGDKSLLSIVKIHDKPKLSVAKNLLRNGALKSSGIIISTARLLWQCCKKVLPELFEKMEYVYQVILHFKGDKIGDDYIKMATSHAYYHLPNYNFNTDLINKSLEKFQAFPITTTSRSRALETENTLCFIE